MNFKALIVMLVLMFVVASFSVQNGDVITVRFLYWHFVMSQALVIILAALFGALAGAIAGAVMVRRKTDGVSRPPTSGRF